MRIYFDEIQAFDMKKGTCFIRELEMTVESGAVPKGRRQNLPLVLQFFKDLELYGLDGALAYVEDYELKGEYEDGTHAELVAIADRLKPELEKQKEKERKKALKTFTPCNCGAKYLKQGINWWCPSCKGNFIVE